MERSSLRKVVLILFTAAIVAILFGSGLGRYLTLDQLKANYGNLMAYYNQDPLIVVTAYFVIYVFSTAVSLPGATILTLAGGAIFGWLGGVVIVSFASTIGALLAFWAARFLLRDFVARRFPASVERINEGFARDGAYFLLTLRLIPLFPFFLINLAMGLTSIRTRTYFVVSQIGMLPATIAYVNAGTQLASIHALDEILSWRLWLSFTVLGLLPLICKLAIERYERVHR